MIRTSHYDRCEDWDTYLRGAKNKDLRGEVGKGKKIGEQSHVVDTVEAIQPKLGNSGAMPRTPCYECCKRRTTALRTRSASRSQTYALAMVLLGYKISPKATEHERILYPGVPQVHYCRDAL
jgi:hypothetical protein